MTGDIRDAGDGDEMGGVTGIQDGEAIGLDVEIALMEGHGLDRAGKRCAAAEDVELIGIGDGHDGDAIVLGSEKTWPI